MEFNISELRKQGRPLWLSDVDADDYSDFLGGGGDIYTDRLPPMWERQSGSEITEVEAQQITQSGLTIPVGSEAVA